jgi:FKBP-type peptidyl-prolyl cis-trans isomerase
MATTKGQRIGIWVIAGTMMIGTVGGFVAMMVAPGNQAREQAELQKAQDEYTAALQEYQKKVTEQNEQYDAAINAKVAELGLNEKYVAEFSGYASRVSAFNKDEVTELKTEDLKVGDGEEIKDDSNVAMYYIGWNPDGKIFDQSIDGETLKSPLSLDGVGASDVIVGWKKGLLGMKVGGVRELTIPSDMAYGATARSEDIPANTPLKFVVMAIPSLGVKKPETIPEPEAPKIVKDFYKRNYGYDL